MDSKLANVLKFKEDMNKSGEQLSKEKGEILGQRIPKLDLQGLYKKDLVELAQQFQSVILQCYTYMYELQERQEKQKYDMMELAERARQIEKGKAKTRKSNIVHTGLGGSVFNSLTETFPQAPQKISLFSRYERVVDRRTFKDRRELWDAPKVDKNFVPEKPKAKIKHVIEEKPTTKLGRSRVKKPEPKREEEEEKPVEEEKPAEQEEEPVEEEERPAEEEEPAEETEQPVEEEEERNDYED